MNGALALKSFGTLSTAPSNSSKAKPDLEWLKSKQEKFLRCPKCGCSMSLIPSTNVMACSLESCGFTKLLDSKSQIYAKLIFR